MFSYTLLTLFHFPELTRLYSQMRWLGQHNADLVLWNIDANTKMIDLGARQRALEEELARTAGECDAQRATVEQKSQEAEAQTAELQRVRTLLEQKVAELQGKEAELQCEKATVAMLSETLEEKGKALEEKEVAIRNAEAASRRRRTPCPRSRRPPESSRRKRRRISRVSARDFAVVGF